MPSAPQSRPGREAVKAAQSPKRPAPPLWSPLWHWQGGLGLALSRSLAVPLTMCLVCPWFARPGEGRTGGEARAGKHPTPALSADDLSQAQHTGSFSGSSLGPRPAAQGLGMSDSVPWSQAGQDICKFLEPPVLGSRRRRARAPGTRPRELGPDGSLPAGRPPAPGWADRLGLVHAMTTRNGCSHVSSHRSPSAKQR